MNSKRLIRKLKIRCVHLEDIKNKNNPKYKICIITKREKRPKLLEMDLLTLHPLNFFLIDNVSGDGGIVN